MAGSPPNLHTMVPSPACIQDVLKIKVKGHVIRALLWCHEMFAIQNGPSGEATGGFEPPTFFQSHSWDVYKSDEKFFARGRRVTPIPLILLPHYYYTGRPFESTISDSTLSEVTSINWSSNLTVWIPVTEFKFKLQRTSTTACDHCSDDNAQITSYHHDVWLLNF